MENFENKFNLDEILNAFLELHLKSILSTEQSVVVCKKLRKTFSEFGRQNDASNYDGLAINVGSGVYFFLRKSLFSEGLVELITSSNTCHSGNQNAVNFKNVSFHPFLLKVFDKFQIYCATPHKGGKQLTYHVDFMLYGLKIAELATVSENYLIFYIEYIESARYIDVMNF